VRPSISIPLSQYPVYPAYLCSPWPSTVGPNVSSAPSHSSVASQIHPNSGRVPVNLVHSPFGGSPFDPNFHSSSSESPNSLDELVTPLEDIRLSEPFARRQSYPLTTPSSTSSLYGPTMSPTSAYAGFPSHYVDRFGISSPKASGLSHHSRRSSSQSSRKLAASYKSMRISISRCHVIVLTIIQPNRVNSGGKTATVPTVRRVHCRFSLSLLIIGQ